MLRSYLCDYRDPYFVITETKYLLAAAANENVKAEKDVYFKNNAPIAGPLMQPVTSSVVKGISGRGVSRAGRGYKGKKI